MKNLMHYGILGMKWGRRKGGGSVSVGRGVRGTVREVGGLFKDALKDDIGKVRSLSSRLTKKIQPSEDFVKTNKLKKKPVSQLSNDELKTAIQRMQLEKQFKDLNKNTTNRGRGIVSKILLNVGAKLVNSYAQTKVDPRFVSIFEQMRSETQKK